VLGPERKSRSLVITDPKAFDKLFVPRERQSPEPPELIAGTLPYMAPEQTGRMNRSIRNCTNFEGRQVWFLFDQLHSSRRCRLNGVNAGAVVLISAHLTCPGTAV
jgi:hypothetical protein